MTNRDVSMLQVALFAMLLALGGFVPSSMAISPQTQNVCPVEKAACGKCGDGYCNKRCGETAASCPRDCGVSSESMLVACGRCGDGYCAKQCGENAASCPKDCAVEARYILAIKGR
jgi:uncharacterized low-complexity protein